MFEEWTDLLPFDADAGPEAATLAAAPSFAYIGRGLTATEFTQYVNAYHFGSIPPDFVVLHHTAIPSASWAPFPSGPRWDSDEQGLSISQIYQKRLKQLTAIKEYYRTRRSWSAGPHLFIDERWIWLMTPMYDPGIHAAQGNSYVRDGRLHYSVGIEVIGYYKLAVWPTPVAQLVGHAVAVLQQRLKTFDLKYQKFAGGISSHRDYNKPECPGAAISKEFYLQVIRDAAKKL